MTPNGFDRLARPYQWMEYLSFGSLLQKCRTRYLSRLTSSRDALVLGDGDGRFTQSLLRKATGTSVTAIDGSSAMLRELHHRCEPDVHRLTTHQAQLPAGLAACIEGQTFDLVATHFFLDCLTTAEVEVLARAIRTHLTRDALWVISDFAIPPGSMRLPASLLVHFLYKAFHLLTGLRTQRLPDHTAALAASNFKCIQRETALGGLLVMELWRPS